MTLRKLASLASLALLLPLCSNAQDAPTPVRLAGEKLGLTDSLTKQLGTTRFDAVGLFHDGFMPVRIGTKWGYANRRGALAIRPAYDEATPFHEGGAEVRIGSRRVLIDTLGTEVSDIRVAPLLNPPLDGPRNVAPASNKRQTPAARTAVVGACPDNLELSDGTFANWQTNTGSTSSTSTTTNITLGTTWRIGTNTVGRQTIVDRVANPTAVDFYGQFPVNPANGGRYALKLGNDGTGAQAEAVRYRIDVPLVATNASVTFSYAVVFESPSHTIREQPRFRSRMYDPVSGESIDCASFEFAALGPLPGFMDAPVRRITSAVVRYKPWSSVYVNLSKFAGRSIYLEFTTADCTLGAHFGYAYVDVTACGVSATSEYNCAQNKTDIVAPPGFETYEWYPANNFSNAIGSGQNLTIAPNPPVGSQYSVIVKPYPNTGCPVCNCNDTLLVTVGADYPVANAGPDRAFCAGDASAQLGSTGVTGITYQWAPGSYLNDPTLPNPVASPPVATTYVLTATGANGCSKTDTVFLDIGPKPQVNFNVTSAPAQCLRNNAFTFVNASTISTGNLQYQWYFGDGGSSTAANPSHSYSVAGAYNVRLLVSSEKGCVDSFSRPITVYANPDANPIINAAAQCFSGNSFAFAGSGSIAGGASLTYSWSMGDNTLYNTQSVTHHYGATGSYPVTLIVSSSDGCTDSTQSTVLVHPQPSAAFAVTSAATQCFSGNSFTVSNSSSIANGTLQYTWNFGDGSSVGGATPAHSYSSDGAYTIRLLATSDKGCVDSTFSNVSIFPRPLPAAQVASGTQCLPGNLFVFNNTSSTPPGSSYQWSMGDGTILTTTGVSYSYASAGSYTVRLQVTTTDGCIDSVRVPVLVLAKPVASFALTTAEMQCQNGNSFAISNTSTLLGPAPQFSWNFGDGFVTSAQQPAHAFASPGTYQIHLVVASTDGCKDSTDRTVTVHPKPAPAFNVGQPRQCLRSNSFSFQNNSGISAGNYTSSWSFGDGNSLTSANAIHAFGAPGTYNVTLLLVSDKGCKDSLLTPVTVDPDPVAAFSISPAQQCLNGNAFPFQNNSSILSGSITPSWSFGDGDLSPALNPAHTYTQAGSYTVQLLVVSGNGCRDSIRQPVTVHPKPVPALLINNPQQCLQGNSFVFNSSSSAIASGTFSALIHYGDGTSGAGAHSYTAAGTYPVNLVLTSDHGCRDSLGQNVTVNPHPAVDISSAASQVHCLGDSAQLTATGAQTWSWSPAQGLSCPNCPAPKASPATSQTYTVQGWNAFGCGAKDTVRLEVKLPIQVRANSLRLCRTDRATLQASGAASYAWSPAAGLSDPSSASPVFTGSTSTTYQLVGFDGFNCFNDTIQVPVSVYPLPEVDAGPDLSLPTGAVQQLNATIQNGPITSWQWLPSLGLSCTNCPNPELTVHQDMSYVIRVVNGFGCRSTDTLHLTAFCKDAQLFVANAFTPNGDGVNDLLYVQGSGIARIKHFRIFNRWGELVYEANNFVPNDTRYSWDGKVRGVAGPPDVYVYTAEAVCDNKAEFTFKGNVTVLK
jgi:gliding motility-associated-like protein